MALSGNQIATENTKFYLNLRRNQPTHIKPQDQDCTIISGLEAQEKLVDEWAADFCDNARSRDTVYIVLSTPEGSDPEQVEENGKKLDPRKADLDRMRKRFAEICRSKGIKVEASHRYERGLGGKSTKSELYQMKRRGKKPEVDSKLEKRVKEEVSKKDFNQ